MDSAKFEDGHCPKCSGKRADIVYQHEESYLHSYFHETITYSILECRGCGEHYFKTCYTNSEDISMSDTHGVIYNKHEKYWPPSGIRRKPEWEGRLFHKDPVLRSLFNDVYVALDNNLGILADAVNVDYSLFQGAPENGQVVGNLGFLQRGELGNPAMRNAVGCLEGDVTGLDKAEVRGIAMARLC